MQQTARIMAVSFILWLVPAAVPGADFVHPGLLHTQADLDRVKEMVSQGAEPWKSGFEKLRVHPQSQADWRVRGPFARVVRGQGENLHRTELAQDGNAAYQNALMWAITEDEAYARKAIEILNAWSAALREIEGHDKELAASLSGFGTLLFTLPALPCSTPAPGGEPSRGRLGHMETYAIGADLSFLKQAEDRGTVFKDEGQAKPGLRIFRDHGYNWIRLRLFHTPTRLPNNLEYTIALARDAKKLGFKFLLDYHYSDTWADPGKQIVPKAWAGKSHTELVHAVREYTRDTIAAFRAAGVLPDMVQPGNEITPGMLWPDGRLPANWDNFVELLKAAIEGVKAGAGDAPCPRIMIHIDKGGNQKATKAFFDKLNSYDIAYDVIGQSFYPWWHGSLDDLRENLAFMADAYHKDIIVVEAAYNWRPTEYRDKKAPFPETPEGQRQFWEQVNRLVLETPHGLGKGVFWWEPAVTGPLRSRGFFDNDGNALPVITVFDEFANLP